MGAGPTTSHQEGLKNGRKAPRSRTGCKRCKERRFKCDEEKPHCGRCQAAGVPCPGYNQSLKWSTKHELLASSKKRRILTPSSLYETSDLLSEDQYGDRPVKAEGDGYRDDLQEATPITPAITFAEHHVDAPVANTSHTILDISASNEINLSPMEITRLPPTPSVSFWSENIGFDTYPDEEEVEQLNFFTIPVHPKREISDSSALVSRRTWIPKPSRGPADFSSALVEYYFKETAGVFSCYDSNLNPFRTTVGNFWTLSPALHRTLQSMAAACLVNENPYFSKLCRKLRAEAMSLLYNDPDQDAKSLLALLMLGQTSSWFDAQDLGVPLFKALKSKIRSGTDITASSGQLVKAGVDRSFFQEALEYWEMLLSFVSSDLEPENLNGPFSLNTAHHTRKVPHPWTGICRETQMLVNQVGQLVRSERIRLRSEAFTWHESIDRSTTSFQLAQYLELRLKNLSEPADEEIVSPGDTETPIWHLQRIAEVYRRTGLINLYRVFPDLLISHLNQIQPSDHNHRYYSHHPQDQGRTSLSPSDNWLGLVEDDLLASLEDDSLRQRATSSCHQWLTDFAVETLDLLESIPASSRTRCLQPFMLVVCASELRAPPAMTEGDENDDYGGGNNGTLESTMMNPVASSHHHNINNTSHYGPSYLPRQNFPISPTTHFLSPTPILSPLSTATRSPQSYPPSNHPFPFSTTSASAAGSATVPPNIHPFPQPSRPTTEDDSSSLKRAFRVFHARRFVRGRLNLFMNVLPPRPTKTCLDLVEAVWERLDEGLDDDRGTGARVGGGGGGGGGGGVDTGFESYWVDVMLDKGLHTTMG